ncbi:MAG: hypothetical protein HUJ60_03410 [Bacilli bacterium]|nr:hypothetical protein [Bacilli bacterium]
MEVWQIVLLILLIVGFFYVIVILVTATHGLEFHGRLRRRVEALSIVMAEKQRLLLSAYARLEAMGVKLSKEEQERLESISRIDFERMNHKEAKLALDQLKSVASRLSLLLQGNRWATKDEQIRRDLSELKENELSIRSGTSAYNAEAVALNYWLSIPTAGWINYLFGIRKRGPIA